LVVGEKKEERKRKERGKKEEGKREEKLVDCIWMETHQDR
jgi:hypothetical protein